MKAIIIDDKDCKALLDQLKLRLKDVESGEVLLGASTLTLKTPKEIHRAFHYIVYNWLHDQGYTQK